jgi:tRNA dimethylallyltransferase
LLAQGVTRERFKEIGFEYLLTLEYADGLINKEELVQKFIEKNWQYAKRQLLWLKRDTEIEWFTPENHPAIFERVDVFLQKQKS